MEEVTIYIANFILMIYTIYLIFDRKTSSKNSKKLSVKNTISESCKEYKQGRVIYFDTDGNIVCGEYLNNKMDGWFDILDNNYKIKEKLLYDDGVLVNKLTYKNGKKFTSTKYSDGDIVELFKYDKEENLIEVRYVNDTNKEIIKGHIIKPHTTLYLKYKNNLVVYKKHIFHNKEKRIKYTMDDDKKITIRVKEGGKIRFEQKQIGNNQVEVKYLFGNNTEKISVQKEDSRIKYQFDML